MNPKIIDIQGIVHKMIVMLWTCQRNYITTSGMAMTEDQKIAMKAQYDEMASALGDMARELSSVTDLISPVEAQAARDAQTALDAQNNPPPPPPEGGGEGEGGQ